MLKSNTILVFVATFLVVVSVVKQGTASPVPNVSAHSGPKPFGSHHIGPSGNQHIGPGRESQNEDTGHGHGDGHGYGHEHGHEHELEQPVDIDGLSM